MSLRSGEICSQLLMQLLIFVPRMVPLAHLYTYVNNTESQVWAKRGSVRTASSIGSILWELSLVDRRQHIHASVGRVPGEDNKMADAASQITHLPYRKFLSHFCTHFPQSKPWHLLPLTSMCRRNLSTMLNNKQSPRVSQQPSSRKMPSPGANGGTSAAGCKSPPTSKTFKTPLLSSRLSPRASVPAFYSCKVNLSISDLLINTSARLVNYLHPWGPTTPSTTTWGSSTFGRDASWCPTRRNIILQQECGPYLPESSNPWTPPPREPPQEIPQSATSPGSPSSSSSGQVNTARAVPTLPSTTRTLDRSEERRVF